MKRNANTTAVATATAWTFTADHLTANGRTFPASYSVARNEDVYVFATVALPNSDATLPVRMHITQDMPMYGDCLAAARAAAAAAKAARDESKPAQPAKQAETKAEAKPAEPAKPVAKPAAKPAKQAEPAAKVAPAAKQPKAKAAVPAKPVAKAEAKPAAQPAKPEAKPAPVAIPADNAWIGTVIKGNGWNIAFDEAAQRTRVLFQAAPSAKQKAAIDAAGFYWSNATNSWNKKLTRKAYRAAMALAETLNALGA